MNKAELIERVAKKSGHTKALCSEMTDFVFDSMSDGLKADGLVNIAGFGNFKVKATKGRKGRNPRTGQEITIKPGKRIGFSAGKALKEAVGGKKK